MDEEKVTAVYLMVWSSELKPEDGGSYERPLEAQKAECLAFLKGRGEDTGKIVFYTNRSHLLKDIERGDIKRLVLRDLKRLGSSDEVDGILFELKMSGIEVVSVE